MLEKEIHITNVLKDIRILKGLLRETTTSAEWQAAIAKYQYKSLEVDEQSDNELEFKELTLETIPSKTYYKKRPLEKENKSSLDYEKDKRPQGFSNLLSNDPYHQVRPISKSES